MEPRAPVDISRQQRLMDMLEQFEQAWQAGSPPDLAEFVRISLPGTDHRDAIEWQSNIEELIKIDLEYRWRNAGAGDHSDRGLGTVRMPIHPRLEDYVEHYPDIGPINQLSLALIAEEYRVRWRFGDRPSRTEYETRFPDRGESLTVLLAQIDKELVVEGASPVDLPINVNRPSDKGIAITATTSLQPMMESDVAVTATESLAAADTDPDGTADNHAGAKPDCPAALVHHPRYRVVRLLGSGGMGSVYAVEDLVMGRMVALKAMSPKWLGDSSAVARFRREVQVAAKLAHPNIVRAYDAGEVEGTHFLVMELVDGMSLAKLMEEQEPLQVYLACDYIRQAAHGLDYAAQHTMVHRDIKPQNLMRSVNGQIKILDFGLAHFASSGGTASSLTESGLILGTPDFMAPEQAHDSREADVRADIYSLGCTLYFLLSGQPPFPGGSAMKKLLDHQNRSPRSLREVRDDMPEGLDRVVSKMIAKLPAQRYQTPAEVVEALDPFCKSTGQTVRSRRRMSWRQGAVLVGMLLLVTILVLMGNRFWPESRTMVEVFHDTFDGAVLDANRWHVTHPLVEVEDHKLVLNNRAYVHTVREFPNGLTATFGWTWIEGPGTYADHLTIAVRTSGKRHPESPEELSDGIAVRFDPYGKRVKIVDRSTEKELSAGEGLVIEQSVRQKIRIVDDGETISAYVGDYPKPVVSAKIPDTADHHYLVIYNRETVGGPKISTIDDFLLEVPAQAADLERSESR